MSQDPSHGFRDIGLSIVPFMDGDESPIPSNVLLRGPLLANRTYEQLGCAKSIINLRYEPDDVSHLRDPSLVCLYHYRMGNKSNVYDTQSQEVRTWLANVFRLFESPVDLPILIHCKHGRDRTGVAVAVLLMILGVPRNAIVEEFLLTDGAKVKDLQRTFAGIKELGGVDKYFEGMLDLEAIRGRLSWTHAKGMRRELFKEASLAIKRKEDPRSSCQMLLDACECGLKLKPEDAEMCAGLGWALVHLGRRSEAHQAFTMGLRLAACCDVKEPVVKMMLSEMQKLKIEPLTDALSTADKEEPERTMPDGP